MAESKDPITRLGEQIAEAQKMNLFAAAISIVGPRENGESYKDYQDAILDASLEILELSQGSAGSDLGHLLVPGIRRYKARLISLERDPIKPGRDWSTRLLVTLGIKPTDYARDGIEQIRTERTDYWDGSGKRVGLIAKDILAQAQKDGEDHDVLVWVAADGEDGKFRALRHIQDLGVARD